MFSLPAGAATLLFGMVVATNAASAARADAATAVVIGAMRCYESPIRDASPNVQRALRYLQRSPHARQVLASLKCHSPRVTILERSGLDTYVGDGIIVWDPHSALRTTDGGVLSPALCLLHELGHAASVDDESGALSLMADRSYNDVEERRVIETVEAPAARELGESVRHDHGGKVFFVRDVVDR